MLDGAHCLHIIRFTSSGPEPAIIETGGDFGIRAFVFKQSFDLRNGFRIRSAMDGSIDSLGGPTLEPNVSRNLLLVAMQRDILQQETNHPFSFPVGRVGVLPDLRKITGEVEYL